MLCGQYWEHSCCLRCVQIEMGLLYDAFAWSVDGLQVQLAPPGSPGSPAKVSQGQGSAGSQVLYPARASGSLRLAKLPDALVPRMRVQLELAALEVALSREQAEQLRAIPQGLSQPDSNAAAEQRATAPAQAPQVPAAAVLSRMLPSLAGPCKIKYRSCQGPTELACAGRWRRRNIFEVFIDRQADHTQHCQRQIYLSLFSLMR